MSTRTKGTVHAVIDMNADMIFFILVPPIAIIRIPGKSSGVQSAHGCVVVLGGRHISRFF